MDGSWYSGTRGQQRPEKPVELPVSLLEKHTDPKGYLADEGLVDAVNVALHLGQPLLLTGKPGTGKTQLAFSLAWALGYDGSGVRVEGLHLHQEHGRQRRPGRGWHGQDQRRVLEARPGDLGQRHGHRECKKRLPPEAGRRHESR